jgi:hypothetical protein
VILGFGDWVIDWRLGYLVIWRIDLVIAAPANDAIGHGEMTHQSRNLKSPNRQMISCQ